MQIAVTLQVARSTLHFWAERHEEFSAALKRAKECEQAFWEQLVMDNLTNRQFNAALWKKSMEARFRNDYTTTKKQELSGAEGAKTPNLVKIHLVAPDGRDKPISL